MILSAFTIFNKKSWLWKKFPGISNSFLEQKLSSQSYSFVKFTDLGAKNPFTEWNDLLTFEIYV